MNREINEKLEALKEALPGIAAFSGEKKQLQLHYPYSVHSDFLKKLQHEADTIMTDWSRRVGKAQQKDKTLKAHYMAFEKARTTIHNLRIHLKDAETALYRDR